MVDGQPRKVNQNNRTALLAERARSFYNASREDFIDNVKQFAYEPDRDRVGRRTRRGDASGCRGGPAPVRARTFLNVQP